VREVAILKALGGTQRRIAGIFSVEFSLLGAVSGLIGGVLANVFTRIISDKFIDASFEFDAKSIVVSVIGTILVANLAGWLASAKILGQRPLTVLNLAAAIWWPGSAAGPARPKRSSSIWQPSGKPFASRCSFFIALRALLTAYDLLRPHVPSCANGKRLVSKARRFACSAFCFTPEPTWPSAISPIMRAKPVRLSALTPARPRSSSTMLT
jgi:hypothetical protein